MTKLLPVLSGMILLAALEQAVAGPSLSYTGTRGDQGYTGTNLKLSADSKAGLYVEGGLNQYESAASQGTFKSYSAGLGISRPGGSLGLSGSFTPKIGGYQAFSAGLDASVRVLNLEEAGGFKASLGLGLNRTTHQDDQQLVVANDGGGIGTSSLGTLDKGSDGVERADKVRDQALSIHQNDLTASLRMRLKSIGTGLSVGMTKSIYDESLTGNFLRESKIAKFPGVLETLQGYPDRSTFVRLSQDVFPWLWASASYSRVQFNLATASAGSYNLETGASWKFLEATVGYSRYAPSSGASRDYWSFGVGIRP